MKTNSLWKLQPKMCGAFLLGISCFPSMALAGDGEYMNLYSKGSTQSILLDDVGKITFGDDAVNVMLTDETVTSVFYNDLRKVTFGEKVQTTANDEIKHEIDEMLSIVICHGDEVVISGRLPIENVSIYNLQGGLIQQLSPQVENVTLSIVDYPSGVYIICVNNGGKFKTEKIIKQ